MELGHNWAISDMFSWKKIFSPKFEHFSRDIEHCVKNEALINLFPPTKNRNFRLIRNHSHLGIRKPDFCHLRCYETKLSRPTILAIAYRFL